MKVELVSDHPVTEEGCLESTGKPLSEWIAFLEAHPDLAAKRRDATQDLYNQMGRGKDIWWPTTVFVEYQRKHNIVKKDGLFEGYNICATKTIGAPVEEVFKAWTTSDITKWLGEDVVLEPDMSISDSNGNVGKATRVRENKDLRYVWQTAGVPNETALDVTFPDNGKGKVTVMANHARIQTREEADGLRRAWGEAFDRLKALVEM